ncbi:polysaccharide deacetylase family protein, partial [Bradyrhizobium sp.]
MSSQPVFRRDFVGYGGRPPHPRWPGDARIAVSVVVNFEEGSEFSVSDGDASNEAIYEVVHRLEGPDPCIDSHFEYGTRTAWWRIMDLFDSYGVKVTVSACGRAVERSPDLARDAVARGHEISAHGWRWQSHAGMAEPEERRVIARTVATIQ